MRKMESVGDGKIFGRQKHRRPAKETALAIQLGRDFSDDLGRTTQINRGGRDGVPFVLIRRNLERFVGTGTSEVGGIGGLKKHKFHASDGSLGGGDEKEGSNFHQQETARKGRLKGHFEGFGRRCLRRWQGSWSSAMVEAGIFFGLLLRAKRFFMKFDVMKRVIGQMRQADSRTLVF